MKPFHPTRHAPLTTALLATVGVALGIVATPALARDVALPIHSVEIAGAVSVIGFERIKPQSGGRMTLGDRDITFASGQTTSTIPFGAVRAFTIEHSNKGLLRGTKGTIASLAPQGAGQLYNVFRPGAETLTIFYTDENRALHGAVTILPKDRKDDVLKSFAHAGLTPNALPLDAPRFTATMTHAHRDGARSSVLVMLPVSTAPNMPTAFTVGIYEELMTRLAHNPGFETVWRQGDVRADHDALTLSMTVTKMQKGNAGRRGAIPVVGMLVGKTLIAADLRLADASGAVLMTKSLKGSKRTMGESMAATTSLAQRASKALETMPALAANVPARMPTK